MGRLALPFLAALFLVCLLVVPARAAENPTYLALGDSLAFGLGSSDPPTRSYVGQAFELLRDSERYRDASLELVNLAVPGATSSDLAQPGGQLEAAVREIAQRKDGRTVEIISIDIGGNDLLNLGASTPGCLIDPLSGDCQKLFDGMLSLLRTNVEQALRQLRQAAPEAEIVVVGLYNPYSGTGMPLEAPGNVVVERINSSLRAAGEDPGLRVKIADVAEFFVGRGRQWISADGFHANDRGYAMMAEALVATVEERTPAIPESLAQELPAPTIVGLGGNGAVTATFTGTSSDGGSDVALILAIAIPVTLLAGVIVGGAYFIAKGRL